MQKEKNEEEKNEGGVIGALKSAGGKIKKALTPRRSRSASA